jgi:hypothetical protein
MVAFGRALSEALRRVLKVCGWFFHGDLRPGSSHDLAAEVTVSTCCASLWTSNNARRPRRCSDRPWQLIVPTRSRSAQTRRRAPSVTETSQNRAAIPAVPISAPTRIPTLNAGGPPRARAATPNTSGCTFSSTACPSSPGPAGPGISRALPRLRPVIRLGPDRSPAGRDRQRRGVLRRTPPRETDCPADPEVREGPAGRSNRPAVLRQGQLLARVGPIDRIVRVQTGGRTFVTGSDAQLRGEKF